MWERTENSLQQRPATVFNYRLDSYRIHRLEHNEFSPQIQESFSLLEWLRRLSIHTIGRNVGGQRLFLRKNRVCTPRTTHLNKQSALEMTSLRYFQLWKHRALRFWLHPNHLFSGLSLTCRRMLETSHWTLPANFSGPPLHSLVSASSYAAIGYPYGWTWNETGALEQTGPWKLYSYISCIYVIDWFAFWLHAHSTSFLANLSFSMQFTLAIRQT